MSDIVADVEKYFFEDDELFNTLEDWAVKNCDGIDLKTDENKFQYSKLHEEYQKLFEDKVTSFIESKGSSVQQFYEIISKTNRADINSKESQFGQLMAGIMEFDVFIQMMRETKESKQKGLYK